LPSIILSSAIVVLCWGYFLYIGVIDPNGGVNILWPLFGIANQMLAAIALSVGTAIFIKTGRIKFAWITIMPLTWLLIITTTAAYQKIFSDDIRIGFLASAQSMSNKIIEGNLSSDEIDILEKLIFNLKLDTGITIFLVSILWIVVFDVLRIATKQKDYELKEVANV
jgi:carbon starvation protein